MTRSEVIRERVLSKEVVREELMVLQQIVIALLTQALQIHPAQKDQATDQAFRQGVNPPQLQQLQGPHCGLCVFLRLGSRSKISTKQRN